MIRNPILRGFNPDPSICSAGNDYYIATSTFEWYPGVQIHHSRDLVNWRLVARPLNRASQLDLRGEPDSCGVWAPCLSFADGLFWLIYTDTRNGVGCPAVDEYQQAIIGTGVVRGDMADRIARRLGQNPYAHEPGEKPAPPEHCAGQYGNSDAFVSVITP